MNCDSKITEEDTYFMVNALSNNTILQELILDGNNLQNGQTKKILCSLKSISSLNKLCISNSNATTDLADAIGL